MCGISGILSKNNSNILDILINSLSIIENRGYDSVGICYNDLWSNNHCILKTLKDSKDLLNKINDEKSYLAIGHTRWATHGGIHINNCHPHISMNKLIVVVHNGIISNYNILKNFLIEKKYNFYSDTDSEIIANYIEFLIQIENLSIQDAISKLQNIFEGTWALLILYKEHKDVIYATRKGSPLLLAESNDYIMLSSETSGFLSMFNNYITLESNDILVINKNGFYSNFSYNFNNLSNYTFNITPDPYKYWMLKEIYEQPVAIMNALNNGARIKNDEIKLGGLNLLKKNLTNNKYQHLLIFGCGTSYHVSMLVRQYFKNCNYFQTINYYDASEFIDYDLPNINDKCIAIFCSQSGETYDIINCLEICKNRNYFTIGIINVVDSFIARSVDCGVYINSGKEVSVASTKSFVNASIVLSMIGMWFCNNNSNLKRIRILRNLNNKVNDLLNNSYIDEKICKLCDFITNRNILSLFILGTDELFPICKEAALKIKEICYIHAEGYSALSLKHGPFALLDKFNMTFLLIQNSKSNRLLSTYNEIISRNTNCFIITDDRKIDISNGENIIFIENLDYYKEILFIIFFQILAYKLAIQKNINPDKPRNLAKVVTVE